MPDSQHNLQIETRSAPATFAPETLNVENGTVEAIISTGAPVQRRGFIEKLALGRENVTLAARLPVLDSHRQGSVSDILGRVSDVRFEPGQIVATLQISNPATLAAIERGDVTGVSIGYSVSSWSDTADASGRNRVRTATAWTLKEVSLVPIPADESAILRSQNMTTETESAEIETTATPDVAQTRAAIRTIARSAGLDSTWADAQIDAGVTELEARAAAFDAMQTRSRQTPHIRVAASAEDPAVQRRAREDALFARASGTAPTDGARSFMGDTLKDHARAILESNGISTRGMDADTIFTRAMHTTSDFSNLLTATGNRVLLAAYQNAPCPVKSLARQATINDFRPKSLLKLSDVGTLQKVTEAGEIKATTRSEAVNSYSLDTYGATFSLSRKAMINDDLGAFNDWGQTAGRMSAETENGLLVSLLTSNPVLGEDGKAMFHDDHGNLAGHALSDSGATLGEGREALRRMKGLDGKTPINVSPKFVLVSPDLEEEAEKMLAAIYAATINDANVFANKYTLLVEPRLADGSAYMFADPAVLPCLEYAYLSSAQGPQMASREGWDTLGMEFRVILDFGCGAIDYRGAYQWA
ncbi:MAG: prohead protease/major capsid protein fusion protein [Asticcacaulis sp.]|uniref:prohead protease/major capsid protein fusion protein n=1 Tax=Asticcacaulis sp. TaxID=1872648 RepID=UPI003F7BEF9A